VPIDGSPLEQVSAYLRIAFAEADARGEAITDEDAQVVASLLAPLAGADSQLARFALTGNADLGALHDECRRLQGHARQTPDVETWLQRLEAHLAARTDLGQSADVPPTAEAPPADNPQITQGVRDHGNAFRAYLQLPDTDPSRDDLLTTFREFYVGSYASMDALLDELTEVSEWEQALDDFARQRGIDEFVSLDRAKVAHIARLNWDIVEMEGRPYVFTK
jgi:hypothetical protein